MLRFTRQTYRVSDPERPPSAACFASPPAISPYLRWCLTARTLQVSPDSLHDLTSGDLLGLFTLIVPLSHQLQTSGTPQHLQGCFPHPQHGHWFQKSESAFFMMEPCPTDRSVYAPPMGKTVERYKPKPLCADAARSSEKSESAFSSETLSRNHEPKHSDTPRPVPGTQRSPGGVFRPKPRQPLPRPNYYTMVQKPCQPPIFSRDLTYPHWNAHSGALPSGKV